MIESDYDATQNNSLQSRCAHCLPPPTTPTRHAHIPHLQVVGLAGRSQHVPLATGLLREGVVDLSAEAPTHLVVRVLHHIVRQVALALAASDHGDHPAVARRHLRGGCISGDHKVAWRGGRRVEREGGETDATQVAIGVKTSEGTVGAEVLHGAVDGFTRCDRNI